MQRSSGTRYLFDIMGKTRGETIPALEDRISTLPDGLLEHVLGFLPADHAVRTSVLARRCRHIWKSMRCIRIRHLAPAKFRAFRDFMDGFLLLRNASVAFGEVKLSVFSSRDEDCWGACINIWIRHLLLCQTKALAITGNISLGSPLLSQHLRRLELCSLFLKEKFLDFARCPVLEDISIKSCDLFSGILSQSVKKLSITYSNFNSKRVRISAPRIVSLQLCCIWGHVPLLGKMPSLETAVFRISRHDYCDKGASLEPCGACLICSGGKDKNADILGALSNTIKLELTISYTWRLILGRQCPIFSRLKALLLSVPGRTAELHSLACILAHSPMLEKLTLQLLEGHKWTGESAGMYRPMKQLPEISEVLDTVEIKCKEINERVFYILKFLGAFIKHIKINLDGKPSTPRLKS